MGSDDEFGPDTMTIRAWLDKRATYAADREVPLPPVGPPTGRARTATLEPTPDPTPPSLAATSRLPDTHDTGRAILEQLGPIDLAPAAPAVETVPETPAESQAQPQAEPEPEAGAEPASGAPSYVVEGVEGEDDLPPAVIEFRPRLRVRRSLTALLLLAVVATAGVGAWAASQPTPGTVGVTACLGVLVLVVWAVRASSSPTRLTIRRGQLEVVRSGQRRTIELASPFTPVAVLGRPGRRGWQVLIEQLDAPVLTLTAADVEPEPFMRVLLRLRPDLRG
jgi:hypothetical protein